MKPRGRTVAEVGANPFRLLLLAVMSSVLAVHITAQTLTTLHSFSAVQNNTNSDGIYPEGKLVLSGNILYGTASQGGTSERGTIFAVHTDGTGFTNLHSFTGYSPTPPYATGD